MSLPRLGPKPSFSRLTSLSPLLLVLLLAACASSNPAAYGEYSFKSSSDYEPLGLALREQPGRITLATSLAKWSKASLVLQQDHNNRLATIIFSDTDCSFGHEVSIWYYGPQSGLGQHLYFGRPIPWGEVFQLDIQWGADQSLMVKLNDEQHQMQLTDWPRRILVNSNSRTVDLVKVHYGEAPQQ